jgi:hypothetical protein
MKARIIFLICWLTVVALPFGGLVLRFKPGHGVSWYDGH